MFTQADLLIVNYGHSYFDYDCAMCFSEPGEALVLFTGGGSPGAVKTYPNSADKPPENLPL